MKKLDFQRRIKTNRKPLIVDIWAPWCRPCKAMEPAFKEIAQKYTGQVDVLKINADESQEVLRELGVMSIPTVIGFAGGKEIMRRTGLQTSNMLDVIFDATLNQRKPAVLPPAPADRVIRTLAGIGALIAAWFFGKSILLFILGGILIFSAFYDRCPIFRAIAPKIKALFQKNPEEKSVS